MFRVLLLLFSGGGGHGDGGGGVCARALCVSPPSPPPAPRFTVLVASISDSYRDSAVESAVNCHWLSWRLPAASLILALGQQRHGHVVPESNTPVRATRIRWDTQCCVLHGPTGPRCLPLTRLSLGN